MPKFTASRIAARPGLYRWVGELLERRHAEPDPRGVDGPRPVTEQLARFREGLPVSVPAWWLDGHGASAAGFAGVVPTDRAVRSVAYTVGPDDTVAPSQGCP